MTKQSVALHHEDTPSLQMYEITLSCVEQFQQYSNKYLRKWLGVPLCFSKVGLYTNSENLQIPISSLEENFTGRKLLEENYAFICWWRTQSTFFVLALLLIVHTWNFSPLRSNLLRLQCTCCTVPTTSARTHGSPLVWVCHSLFHLLNSLITTASELRE